MPRLAMMSTTTDSTLITMLDKWTAALVQPPLRLIARQLKHRHITPTRLTLAGFMIGLLVIPLLAVQCYTAALVVIAINRLLDGLDGALARLNAPTDAGGFLDIVLDFIFYSAVVVGFALANPTQNALAATVLLFSFMGTGSSFLAYAVMAEKHQLARPQFKHKSLHYLGGLTEGTETIVMFALFCWCPNHFSALAYLFAAACTLTASLRIWGGFRTIQRAELNADAPVPAPESQRQI